MVFTEEQRKERDKKIHDAIKRIRLDGHTFSLKRVAQETGLPLSTLYTVGFLTDHIKQVPTAPGQPTNRHYLALVGAGFLPVVTVGRHNTAQLHLVVNGTRLYTANFKANGKNSTVLNTYIQRARYGTAADLAMVDAMKLAKVAA